MARDVSAVVWAQQLPSGARVSWEELEALVFRGRPRVLAELGGAGEFQKRSEKARRLWFVVGMVLAVLPPLAVVLLPFLAFAALGGNDFGLVFSESSVAIPIAGWLMAGSAAWLMVTLLRGLLGGRIEESEVVGWIAAVVGIVVAVLIGTRGTAADVADWPVWQAVSILGAALGVVVVMVARRAQRRRSSEPHPRAALTARSRDPEEAARRAAAIAALPVAQREQIRAELTEAISILRRRGIVTPDEATRALNADLGFIAQGMTR